MIQGSAREFPMVDDSLVGEGIPLEAFANMLKV